MFIKGKRGRGGGILSNIWYNFVLQNQGIDLDDISYDVNLFENIRQIFWLIIKIYMYLLFGYYE